MQKNLGLFMLKEDVTTFMSTAFQAERDTVRNPEKGSYGSWPRDPFSLIVSPFHGGL